MSIAASIKSVDEVHRNGDSVNMVEMNLAGRQLVEKMETTKASVEVSVCLKVIVQLFLCSRRASI